MSPVDPSRNEQGIEPAWWQRALQPSGRALGKSSLLYAAAVGLGFALAMFLQEKYAACGGFGDDGCRAYGPWTRDFVRYVVERRIEPFHASRTLPSAVLYFVLRALRAAPTNANIVRAWELGNVVMVALGAFAWHRIWRHWALRVETLVLGTATIFCTFGIAKLLPFDPVLTDGWAFALSLVATMGFLERRFWLVALATVAGSFCWHTFLYLGVPLLFFFGDAGEQEPPGSRRNLGSWACEIVAIGVGVAWAWYALRLVPRYSAPFGYEPAWRETLRLSVPVAALCLFMVVRELLRPHLFRVVLRRPFAWYRWVALAIAAGLYLGVHQLGAPVPPKVTLAQGFNMLVFTSVAKPGSFLVAHAAFYGPLAILALLRWPRVARSLSAAGPSVAVAFLSGAPLVVDSESRHSLAHFALLAPFVLKTMDELRWRWRTVLAVSAVALGASRIWLTYSETLPKDRSALSSLLGVLGPWMSTSAYVWCGLLAALTAVWLWRVSSKPAP